MRTKLPPVMSVLDLEAAAKQHEAKMNKVVVLNKSNNTVTIHLTYPYEVDLDRIKTEVHLLSWVRHLLGKGWMTTDVLAWFIDVVAEQKGWQGYRNL